MHNCFFINIIAYVSYFDYFGGNDTNDPVHALKYMSHACVCEQGNFKFNYCAVTTDHGNARVRVLS
jgi:hypothetical protein